jgi:hypothetical protein
MPCQITVSCADVQDANPKSVNLEDDKR